MIRRLRPNCTHIVTRCRKADLQCHVCGEIPWTGILYQCEQDRYEALYHRRYPSNGDYYSMWWSEEGDAEPSKEDEESPKIALMKSLDMKEWMIDLARKGHYTDEQLERLMAQKANLIETMKMEEQQNTPLADRVSFPGRYRPRLKYLLANQPICKHQCCHRCRPYMNHRSAVSIDAVFNDEIEPLTPAEASTLSVMDVKVLHNIGLRVSPPKSCAAVSSVASSASTSSSSEYSSEESDVGEGAPLARQHSGGGVSITSSEPPDAMVRPLRRALTNIIRNGHGESTDRHSVVTLPLEGTGALRSYDEDAQEFDLALFRSLDFPQAPRGALPQTEYVASLTTEERRELEDAVTPEGEEVDVEGGVALTEEAVDTHTPDMITQI